MRGETNITSVLMGGVKGSTWTQTTDIKETATQANPYITQKNGFLRVATRANQSNVPVIFIGGQRGSGTNNDFPSINGNQTTRYAPIFLPAGTLVYVSANASSLATLFFYEVD